MSGIGEYLPEVFEQFGRINIRKMFGGLGIYHDGLMFALVADDTLYLKADAQIVRFFEQEGLGPFEYVTDGRTIRMSYYRAPDEIFDDRELAALWARRSFEAAVRTKASKKPPPKKSGKSRAGSSGRKK